MSDAFGYRTYRVQLTVDVRTTKEQDVDMVESNLSETLGQLDGAMADVEIELMDIGHEELSW